MAVILTCAGTTKVLFVLNNLLFKATEKTSCLFLFFFINLYCCVAFSELSSNIELFINLGVQFFFNLAALLSI